MDIGVFFVTPLGTPSENLTGKFYILETFKIFGAGSGPGPGQLIGRHSRPIPYIGHNFGCSMSRGLKIYVYVDHISTTNWQNYNPQLIVYAEIWPFYCILGLAGPSVKKIDFYFPTEYT